MTIHNSSAFFSFEFPWHPQCSVQLGGDACLVCQAAFSGRPCAWKSLREVDGKEGVARRPTHGSGFGFGRGENQWFRESNDRESNEGSFGNPWIHNFGFLWMKLLETTLELMDERPKGFTYSHHDMFKLKGRKMIWSKAPGNFCAKPFIFRGVTCSLKVIWPDRGKSTKLSFLLLGALFNSKFGTLEPPISTKKPAILRIFRGWQTKNSIKAFNESPLGVTVDGRNPAN